MTRGGWEVPIYDCLPFQACRGFYTQKVDFGWNIMLIFQNLKYVRCQRYINVTTNSLKHTQKKCLCPS